MTEKAHAREVQNCFWQAADVLLYHHTNPWELDAAVTNWGYATGPCAAQDMIGLHNVLARSRVLSLPILPRMVAEGRMGKSGGVGYYRYPGGGGAVIDPLIEDLILEEAWFGKVTRSEMSDTELIKALHNALVPLCQKLLHGGMQAVELELLLQQAIHFPTRKRLADLGL